MIKSTQELLELIKKSPNWDSYLENAENDLIKTIPLHICLQKLLEEKALKKSDIIHLANIDRGYGYEIFSGSKLPSRDKLLSICFAFPLSATEVQTLLKSTGYPQLYARIERDSVILYALEHGLSLCAANELLFEMGYEILV